MAARRPPFVTVLAPPSVEEQPTGELPVVEPAGSGGRGFGKRRLLIVALAGTLLLVVAVLVANGPIANVWYQSRQHHLAADLTAARPATGKGQAVGVLQIPKINLNLMVVEGDGPEELRAGPGHRSHTPLPGQVGNSLIFGHRQAWGGPFSQLGQLHPGDQIFVKARGGAPTLFLVKSVASTTERDTRPLAPAADRRLTLVTGQGGTWSSERLIVTAVAGPEHKLPPPTSRLAATAPRGHLLLNPEMLTFLVLAGVIAMTLPVLRRRYRVPVVAVVVTPLALAGLLALLLEVDLLLPGLR
jgi:sortase A